MVTDISVQQTRENRQMPSDSPHNGVRADFYTAWRVRQATAAYVKAQGLAVTATSQPYSKIPFYQSSLPPQRIRVGTFLAWVVFWTLLGLGLLFWRIAPFAL